MSGFFQSQLAIMIGILLTALGGQMFIDTITRESRPPWAGECNKAAHTTAFGVEEQKFIPEIMMIND